MGNEFMRSEVTLALTAPLSVVSMEACAETVTDSTEVHGLRTDSTGRVLEDRREVIVPEFWVLGGDGRWYEVSEADWRAAEPGHALSLCR